MSVLGIQFKVLRQTIYPLRKQSHLDLDRSTIILFKSELGNDFRFFLGDTIWEPLEDKKGEWRLITWLDGVKVADKTLVMV